MDPKRSSTPRARWSYTMRNWIGAPSRLAFTLVPHWITAIWSMLPRSKLQVMQRVKSFNLGNFLSLLGENILSLLLLLQLLANISLILLFYTLTHMPTCAMNIQAHPFRMLV